MADRSVEGLLLRAVVALEKIAEALAQCPHRHLTTNSVGDAWCCACGVRVKWS